MEQGTGKGLRPRSSHQTTRSGVSTCGNVDKPEVSIWSHTAGARHPVKRTGEREPIPYLARIGVILRDGNTCKLCGHRCEWANIELDHIIPWSANGSDRSENLRVLCRRCNQDRSNFVDTHGERRKILPVTWWCIDCWTSDDRHLQWHSDQLGIDQVPWDTCRLLRSKADLQNAWLAHDWIDPSEDLTLAYCAHCDSNGYTTDPL